MADRLFAVFSVLDARQGDVMLLAPDKKTALGFKRECDYGYWSRYSGVNGGWETEHNVAEIQRMWPGYWACAMFDAVDAAPDLYNGFCGCCGRRTYTSSLTIEHEGGACPLLGRRIIVE